MPQQIYPGQSKFHLQKEEAMLAKQAKRRANKQKHMAKNREKQRQYQINDNLLNEQLMSQQAIEKYSIKTFFLLTCRLLLLNTSYQSLISAQERWPLSLPNSKQFYSNFYDMIQKVSHNIVCGCCGIIEHNVEEFAMVSANDSILKYLAVEPEKVPFSFNCGIVSLDQHHIMVDPLAITDQETLSVCQKCHSSLSHGFLPVEALANFRWIGPVPEELKDLT